MPPPLFLLCLLQLLCPLLMLHHSRTECYTLIKTGVVLESVLHDVTGFGRTEHTALAFWLTLISAEFLVSFEVVIAALVLYTYHTICCSKFTSSQKYTSAGNVNISHI